MDLYVEFQSANERYTLNIYNLFPDSFGANCYVLVSDGHAAVIDPSVNAEKILKFAQDTGATVDKIILTHGHFDHIESIDSLREMLSIPVYIHKDDTEMLTDGTKNAHSLFFGIDRCWRSADILLHDGDEITVGEEKLKVISTPGHSKGSICLLGDGFMITGDTLFANGYGRYDLHGGDADMLADSLSHLRTFDKSITIYPGHGGTAKLGQALDNVLYY